METNGDKHTLPLPQAPRNTHPPVILVNLLVPGTARLWALPTSQDFGRDSSVGRARLANAVSPQKLPPSPEPPTRYDKIKVKVGGRLRSKINQKESYNFKLRVFTCYKEESWP